MSVTEKERLAEFSVAIRESTLKRLELIPSGLKNWKPTKDSMSLADIAQHIIDADKWLFEMLEKKNLSPIKGKAGFIEIKKPEEFAQLLNELKKTGERRKKLIESLADPQLKEMIYDQRFGGEVSVWWVIVRGNLDHEIHHRGQISVYLKMLKAE
jgi:uncharacterized damage-inducible protein DinB